MTVKARGWMVAGVVAALAAGDLAYAGGKAERDVIVSGTTAYGAIGSARASADSWQSIGCYLAAHPTYTYAACRATNAEGVSKQCWTQNAQFISAIGAMPDDAYLYFTWDGTTGECTYLLTDNNSMFRPRQ